MSAGDDYIRARRRRRSGQEPEPPAEPPKRGPLVGQGVRSAMPSGPPETPATRFRAALRSVRGKPRWTRI
jgi:hypothetical protein